MGAQWCNKITGVDEELQAVPASYVHRDNTLESERQLECATRKLHPGQC